MCNPLVFVPVLSSSASIKRSSRERNDLVTFDVFTSLHVRQAGNHYLIFAEYGSIDSACERGGSAIRCLCVCLGPMPAVELAPELPPNSLQGRKNPASRTGSSHAILGFPKRRRGFEPPVPLARHYRFRGLPRRSDGVCPVRIDTVLSSGNTASVTGRRRQSGGVRGVCHQNVTKHQGPKCCHRRRTILCSVSALFVSRPAISSSHSSSPLSSCKIAHVAAHAVRSLG